MAEATASFTIDRTTVTVQIFREDLGDSIFLDLVLIPPGKFLMGSPSDEPERQDSEGPQHEVTIAEPFLMGQSPVTQAQWAQVAKMKQVKRSIKPNPSNFKGDDLPVETVSWLDAEEFCLRLSKHTKRTYRLPSEAEWEYACRAGTTTAFHFGETIDSEVANYQAEDEEIRETVYPGKYGQGRFGKYHGETTPVKTFHANKWGLYDMHGNVCEWCQDEWHDSYVGARQDANSWEDPQATFRVMRGGAWRYSPRGCRSASRFTSEDISRVALIGFRVVCEPPLL